MKRKIDTTSNKFLILFQNSLLLLLLDLQDFRCSTPTEAKEPWKSAKEEAQPVDTAVLLSNLIEELTGMMFRLSVEGLEEQ